MFRYEYQNSSITRLFILDYNTVEHTGTLFDSKSVWLQLTALLNFFCPIVESEMKWTVYKHKKVYITKFIFCFVS